jgi:uncharacterized protein (DUF3084 family)
VASATAVVQTIAFAWGQGAHRRWSTVSTGGDSREADLARREADLERREAAVTARGVALAERMEAAEEILAAADERDARADLRDAAADQRERDLDRARLLDRSDSSEYGDDWPERRNAGLDRRHSKEDREASHEDRIQLTEGPQGREDDVTDPGRPGPS